MLNPTAKEKLTLFRFNGDGSISVKVSYWQLTSFLLNKATHEDEKAEISDKIIRSETHPPVLLLLFYSVWKRSSTGAGKQSKA